jgi:hypothetical protein
MQARSQLSYGPIPAQAGAVSGEVDVAGNRAVSAGGF